MGLGVPDSTAPARFTSLCIIFYLKSTKLNACVFQEDLAKELAAGIGELWGEGGVWGCKRVKKNREMGDEKWPCIWKGR